MLGVLDIDDVGIEAFGDEDKLGLQAVIQVLLTACDWNE